MARALKLLIQPLNFLNVAMEVMPSIFKVINGKINKLNTNTSLKWNSQRMDSLGDVRLQKANKIKKKLLREPKVGNKILHSPTVDWIAEVSDGSPL